MPPASLSTFAVMKPGPTTAKNTRSRTFQLLRNLMRTGHKRNQISENSRTRINGDNAIWIGESAKLETFVRGDPSRSDNRRPSPHEPSQTSTPHERLQLCA